VKQADEQEKQDRADRGIDDGGNDTRAEMNPELRQEQTCNEGANDTHNEVTDKAEAGPLDDLAREPARSDTDNQYDEQIFARYVHVCVPASGRQAVATQAAIVATRDGGDCAKLIRRPWFARRSLHL
jgi:hypothetical protein